MPPLSDDLYKCQPNSWFPYDQALIPFPSICCISAQPIQQGPKPKNPSFAYHHCSYGSGKYRGVNYSDIKHITQRLESSNFRIFWDISCPGFECQMSWGSVKPCPLAWPATYTLIPKVGWLGKKHKQSPRCCMCSPVLEPWLKLCTQTYYL